MDTYAFGEGGRAAALRPAHALQVAAMLGRDLARGRDGLAAPADAVARAAWSLRDLFRCRHVRRDLRLVALGAEGTEGDVRITHPDADALDAAMAAAAAGDAPGLRR